MMAASADRDSGIASRTGFEQCQLEKRSGQSTMIEHSRITLAPEVLAGTRKQFCARTDRASPR
jgi:hypothetical protein